MKTNQELTPLQSTIYRIVTESAEGVIDVSRRIHALAEMSFDEVESAELLAAFLESEGMVVTRTLGGLPTAFVGAKGSGRLTVGVFLEYDALPEVGHACGHNLIAGAGLAATLGLLPLLDELDITLKVFGAPAEEHGGGKALLLESGVFADVALALMVHPFPEGMSFNPAGTSSQVVGRFRAIFTGTASHAAAAPHLAVNAADAAVVTQVAVGLLRQQLPDDHRVALYVAEAGSVTNIIPELAVVNFEARAFSRSDFDILLEKVNRCFEAGALATGAALSIEAIGPVYDALLQDEDLCSHWSAAIAIFGHDVSRAAGLTGGSTDMGNVSQVIPSIHPWIGIPGVASPVHSHDFAAGANTDAAYDVMLQAGVGMAWTVASVASSPESHQHYTTAAARRAHH
ncbi:amidohydrolase [Cryobacterium sp. N21]|uniref:amidohydrolase n=1 Tax=Cryobacterium sp. N21 TaxID=2048289 RepID=UPI0018EBC569|nr:amidohydrolase [Cryobacterium sp. N21]